MDIRLPDGSGIDACRQILAIRPGTRVLVLSSMVTDSLVQEAIAAGAHGYLLKDIDGQGLVSAILDVAAGKSILDPAVTLRVMQLMKSGQNLTAGKERYDSLSPQEQRVLALVAEGLTNKEIASDLKLSEKTVKNYLSNLFDKLQISRRSQAAAFYTQVKAGQN
jgi:two-component system response regulator DevR